MKFKRLIGLILSLTLLLTAVPCVAFAVGSTPQHIPRIVYIVFDDSGSMFDKAARWAYASYAMQSFCAMMDESDELHVVYLNGSDSERTVNLKKSAKQSEIDKFAKIVYGGSTPNKIQQTAELLKARYARVGPDAQYFLLVLADGELDDTTTTVENEIRKAEARILTDVPASNFTCEFFDMRKYGDRNQNDESEISENLRDISAKIMGRDEVSFDLNGGKLSFSIAYPAFSIVVFAQSTENRIGSASLSAKGPEGQIISDVSSFLIACPTSIVKTQSYNEIVPDAPPSGIVSILKTNGVPLKKGSYTVDLSAYSLKKENVAVLIEPAVCIGCQYFIGDSETPETFSELKDKLKIGNKLTIRCGLYEVNEDGSVGAEVPESVLTRDFSVFVNDEPVTELRGGEKNAYRIELDEAMSEGELKIEAKIEGFAPFVARETLGEIRKTPEIDEDHLYKTETIPVTLPDFREMTEGKRSLKVPFKSIDSKLLEDLVIESTSDLFRSGKCSAPGTKIKLNGTDLEYDLTPVSKAAFSDLPDTVEIRLLQNGVEKPVYTFILQKQKSAYRIAVKNPFEKEPLSFTGIKTNDKAVSFELQADFNGSGDYTPYVPDKGVKFEFTAEHGDLPGEMKTDGAALLFTPRCSDPAKLAALRKNNFSVKAKAVIDGETVTSETATITFSQASYRLSVQNGITGPLTLDDLKNNTGKILFTLTADYDGSGNYIPTEPWDNAAYERISVNSEMLPGLTSQEKDASGRITGVSFTPRYDEADPKDVVYTSVVGRTHTVTASLSDSEEQSSAEVEVTLPVFTVAVVEGMDSIEVMDTALIRNERGFGFLVLRDGRPLGLEELEVLTGYTVSFAHGSYLKAETTADLLPDGTAYLKCVPGYKGWKILNWLSPIAIRHGTQEVTFAAGENTAAAQLTVTMNVPCLIIAVVILCSIAVAVWVTVCILTRKRFIRGEFRVYRIRRSPRGFSNTGYDRPPVKSYPRISLKHLYWFGRPSSIVISVGDCDIMFRTSAAARVSTPIVVRDYNKEENGRVRICTFDDMNWVRLLGKYNDFKFESPLMDLLCRETEDPVLEYISIHRGLVIPDRTVRDEYRVIIFISNREYDRLKPEINKI